MAALLLLWVSPLSDPGATGPWWEGRNDGWQARGQGEDHQLAIEALCMTDRPDAAARPASGRDCSSAELMGFAYRAESGVEGQLTLFGVDAQGDPMFYAPTPVDPEAPAVVPGRWRALPMAVRLSINHAEGPLRIYALSAPQRATVDEVRRWTEALATERPAGPGDAAWTQRVPADTLARLCPQTSQCHAAELRLTVAPEGGKGASP